MKILLFAILILFLSFHCSAQPSERPVKVLVVPTHSNWLYHTGDAVEFDVRVLNFGNPVNNIKFFYELSADKLPAFKKDSSTITAGSVLLKGGNLDKPGFLRCVVTVKIDGKEYRGLGTAGIDPDKIKAITQIPDDFDQFWKNAINAMAKIPLDSKMTLLPEKCTALLNVYQVSFRNSTMTSWVYGILCIPKKEGKYPALLRVPGAGVRAYNGEIGLAEKGIITLEIGIHGIPVTMNDQVYADLGGNALNQYPSFNLDNPDQYYYKHVYLGCIRANDFLTSLPQYDGVNLGVCGGSQGGGLSIVIAGLDPRVKVLSVCYPAMCDELAYTQGRAGGWPGLFANPKNCTPDKMKTIGYYDAANFARKVKAPGIYSWGYNDEVCPPSSTYAAYNNLTSEKQLLIYADTGHWQYPEQTEKMNTWLVNKLKGLNTK